MGFLMSKNFTTTVPEKKDTDEIKLLLLGAAESGKSTVLKQMKIIHQNGFCKEEVLLYRSIIRANLIESLWGVVYTMASLNLSFTKDERIQDAKYFIEKTQRFRTGGLTNFSISPDLCETMKRLWTDLSVQYCVRSQSSPNFYDPARVTYFLNRLQVIADEDFNPSFEDILRMRVQTIGITETKFDYSRFKLNIIDVGGQRTQRKKWMHCFDNVHAVIFVASLSDFDQTLNEDVKVNRMHESLTLFHDIGNEQCLQNASLILFLNKKDIFYDKIFGRSHRHSVAMDSFLKCFPDYCGKKNFKEMCNFVLNKYQSVCCNIAAVSPNSLERPRQRTRAEIYSHLTCATDTEGIRVVFESVIDLITQSCMEECGLA